MRKIKNIIIFIILWLLSSFIVEQIGIWISQKVISDADLIKLKLTKEEFVNLIYNNAFTAFLLAYISGKAYVAKFPNKKNVIGVIYSIFYVLIFALLFFFIIEII